MLTKAKAMPKATRNNSISQLHLYLYKRTKKQTSFGT